MSTNQVKATLEACVRLSHQRGIADKGATDAQILGAGVKHPRVLYKEALEASSREKYQRDLSQKF